jgi:hypothetical protein
LLLWRQQAGWCSGRATFTGSNSQCEQHEEKASSHTGVNAQTDQSSKRELLSLGRELRGGVRLLSRVVFGSLSGPGLRLMKGEELEGWRLLGE